MYIDGPYSICTGESDTDNDSDGFVYRTLRWGYDTEKQALADVQSVAEEEGVPLNQLVIFQTINIADLQDDLDALEVLTAPEK